MKYRSNRRINALIDAQNKLTDNKQNSKLSGVMKNDWKDGQIILQLASDLGGVFTTADLATALAETQKVVLFRRIGRLIELNVLARFSRGLYVTEDFRPEVLSQKLCKESCVSFGWVLAEALVIGSKPVAAIDAVKIGRSRTYANDSITVRQFGLSEDLFFGFENEGGILRAVPEKALLDTLYFHQHGVRFFFDIYSDLNLDELDLGLALDMLNRYSNPRFTSFAKGILR